MPAMRTILPFIARIMILPCRISVDGYPDTALFTAIFHRTVNRSAVHHVHADLMRLDSYMLRACAKRENMSLRRLWRREKAKAHV